MMQNAGVFDILTCKCAWRHSGVPFFHHFSTSERPKKWSVPLSFLTFWLENVLLATAACNFSTSQLQKAVRPWGVLYIFTWKCASRHSGVQFFHISTSKSAPRPSVFYDFDLKENVLLATAACNFSTSQLPKVLRDRQFFTILTWKCASRYSGVQFFIATSLTFRACGSSFYWLSRNCIFSLLTLLLFSAVSSSDSAALLCFFNCPYCRKLDF